MEIDENDTYFPLSLNISSRMRLAAAASDMSQLELIVAYHPGTGDRRGSGGARHR